MGKLAYCIGNIQIRSPTKNPTWGEKLNKYIIVSQWVAKKSGIVAKKSLSHSRTEPVQSRQSQRRADQSQSQHKSRIEPEQSNSEPEPEQKRARARARVRAELGSAEKVQSKQCEQSRVRSERTKGMLMTVFRKKEGIWV